LPIATVGGTRQAQASKTTLTVTKQVLIVCSSFLLMVFRLQSKYVGYRARQKCKRRGGQIPDTTLCGKQEQKQAVEAVPCKLFFAKSPAFFFSSDENRTYLD